MDESKYTHILELHDAEVGNSLVARMGVIADYEYQLEEYLKNAFTDNPEVVRVYWVKPRTHEISSAWERVGETNEFKEIPF